MALLFQNKFSGYTILSQRIKIRIVVFVNILPGQNFHLAWVLRRVYAQLVTSYAHTCDLDFLYNEGQDTEVTILEGIFQFNNILFIPRMAIPSDGLITANI